MRFCPICSNYLFLQSNVATSSLNLLCRHCGFNEEFSPHSPDEALILETRISTSTGVNKTPVLSQLNEFTKLDPTLPHTNTIACPNHQCPSQTSASRDILYIKTDAKNLKYQYSCTLCDTQWSS